MINCRKTLILPIITLFVLVPILTLAEVVVASKEPVFAKNLSTTTTVNSGNNDFRNTKEYKELEKRKIKQIADENSTLIKADSIIPGIKGEWEAVISERTEIIKLIMAKENDPKYKRSLSKNHSEEKNIDFGSSTIARDNFSKAVKSEDKDEIKITFNKFITLNKEINEQFRLKLNSN